ncbi:MAG: peptide chain release factor N(5)-glutamine methyltransferase [Acidobacteriota bacterium]|nr:peptide chain release factor N(5)-glutamine methyltransferase [Acidobacteriota bacterium]
MVSIATYLTTARRRLIGAGLEPADAAFDAEVLARQALGWSRALFLARVREPAPPEFAGRFDPLVARRCRREPVSQIIGHREFWGLDIEVSSEVLTPRPESELVIETALTELDPRSGPWRLADIGTGSGCLAIALAHALPQAKIAATDVSPEALEIARRNFHRHRCADRITLHHTSFLDGLSGPFDVIVSNPPYIRADAAPSLPPEVREYEPPAALFGGQDGLDPARSLIPSAAARLDQSGCLVMEIGKGQPQAVNAIGQKTGLVISRLRHDLQDIPRVVVMRTRGDRLAKGRR